MSTNDRDQDPTTQLVVLRDFAQVQGWETNEYIDQASANDLARRTAWRQLLDDAARRRFRVVLVFKLDRPFRSVKHMHDTLDAWDKVQVDFRSVREGFDTSTALGRLLMNLLASLAEFELEVLSERVRAGMDRAHRQGKPIGRPTIAQAADWTEICGELDAGTLSFRQAAHVLKVSDATVRRWYRATVR